MKERLLKT